MKTRALLAVPAFLLAISGIASAQSETKRPMTFMDMQLMRQAGGNSVSPDRKWMLYTVSTMDWKEARRQSDVYVVSMDQGLASTKQLTFTKEKNETSPQWSNDGTFFAFLSNRDAPAASATQNQIFIMRADGGEARRITDAKDGVSQFSFTRDGKRLIFRAGKSGEEQLWSLPVAGIDEAKPTQLTKQGAGVGDWGLTTDGKRAYFIADDTLDTDDKQRREKKFTVNVRNAETPLASLWTLDIEGAKSARLTKNPEITVSSFSISPDGKYVAFRGTSANRYERNITESSINADNYLVDAATGEVERLTNNKEIQESGINFSPDSKVMAFSGPDDMTRYTMKNTRVYVRGVAEKGGQWRKIGSAFDGDVTVSFWSPDAKTIYFNEGIKATNQALALDVASGAVRQLTQEKASINVNRDDRTGTLLINYSDPKTPPALFTVATIDQVANRATWKQLTEANPQVKNFLLGEEEEITWKSKDGKMVGGVLLKPAGYQPGQKYPLIVAIHGGPAGADLLSFNGGYGAQVYAGAGYAVLMPNYRGSTNYGEAHKNGIVGNYFPPGFDDIMSGVDYLIAQGIADGDHMGALGWSAGGHWSNWILTHTDRFKAISSGAGTSNWISMYAESDVQRNRQYYLGDKLPYEDFDAYWVQSPLKYIKNAKTPTMIHVVEGDPRVPSPQSIELHMALKKLGVPTELFLYPGASHGIPDPRNQLVKSVAEMAWMDFYVRGRGSKFAWKDVLKTLEEDKAAKATTTTDGSR